MSYGKSVFSFYQKISHSARIFPRKDFYEKLKIFFGAAVTKRFTNRIFMIPYGWRLEINLGR